MDRTETLVNGQVVKMQSPVCASCGHSRATHFMKGCACIGEGDWDEGDEPPRCGCRCVVDAPEPEDAERTTQMLRQVETEVAYATLNDAGTAVAHTESDGDFLARLGMDGEKWTDAFLERFQVSCDRDTLHGWFANAIMAGYDRGVGEGAVRFYERAKALLDEAVHPYAAPKGVEV